MLKINHQEPIIAFKHFEETLSGIQPLTVARFGASAVNHQGLTWIVGGIVKSGILTESTEVCVVDSQAKVCRAVLSRPSNFAPRPLLIGSSVVSTGSSLLVVGGSAVCFSFGTAWNNGCYTLRMLDNTGKCASQKSAGSPIRHWRFLHTVAAPKPTSLPIDMPFQTSVNSMIDTPRMKVGSSVDFDQILRSARPVILEGLDLGPCTNLWTSNYLKEHVGADREVRLPITGCH
jgi:tRNA wybutosine-synthesizing protein 4